MLPAWSSKFEETTRLNIGSLGQMDPICCKWKVPPLQASVQDIIIFLSDMFDQGLSYSTINSARAAVISPLPPAQMPAVVASSVLLSKFMKEVFNARPSIPKVGATWDVNVFLKYLSTLSPPMGLTLYALGAKLATLLVLLSGQRGQSVHLLKIDDVECEDTQLILRFTSLLKHSKPGNHLSEIVLPAYPEARLCVCKTFFVVADLT